MPPCAVNKWVEDNGTWPDIYSHLTEKPGLYSSRKLMRGNKQTMNNHHTDSQCLNLKRLKPENYILAADCSYMAARSECFKANMNSVLLFYRLTVDIL